MKVTVRCTVIIPDNYARIQRLYDHGTFFMLDEEDMSDAEQIADFIEKLKARGGKMIETHDFMDDDDFNQKTSATFEYISE